MKYKELNLPFIINRQNTTDYVFIIIFKVSFILLTLLLAIGYPLLNGYSDLRKQEMTNQILQEEIDNIVLANNSLPKYTFKREYEELNDVRVGVQDLQTNAHLYIEDILEMKGELVVIDEYTFSPESNLMKLLIRSDSERALTDFIINLYEYYGYDEVNNPEGWIMQYPSFQYLNKNILEVKIDYA